MDLREKREREREREKTENKINFFFLFRWQEWCTNCSAYLSSCWFFFLFRKIEMNWIETLYLACNIHDCKIWVILWRQHKMNIIYKSWGWKYFRRKKYLSHNWNRERERERKKERKSGKIDKYNFYRTL